MEDQQMRVPGKWITIGDQRLFVADLPPSLSWMKEPPPRQNPLWKRILVVLMRVVGWIVLIPAAVGLLGSAIMVTLASFTLNPGAFIVWSVISGVMGGITALGVLMTGVAKDKE